VTVEHIEVLVEEQSMETALRLLLPKILGGIPFRIYPYQGKADLLGKLPNRLRGYSSWLPQTWRIVVIVDRDNEDCIALKSRLEVIALNISVVTKSSAKGNDYVVVNRIAVEELEAWYFGDWAAITSAFPGVPENIPRKAKYRDPDAIAGGTWESLERILRKAGYFQGGFRKIEAARLVAAHMDPARNRSRSFQVFREALREMSQ
jgi:hypothetical protein